MEVTLQVLQTLPEENYQVLRFLTAFLVQVRLQPSLCCSPGGGQGGAATCAAPGQLVARCGGGVCGSLLQLSDFPPQVSANSDQNKMTNTNLAVVFGPNLLWAKDAAITLKAINPINTFTKFLLDHQAELFPSPDS